MPKNFQSNPQSFARKLIRPFGFLTEKDVSTELQMIKFLLEKSNPHIIRILDYGKLEVSRYYYIDMDLCAINLEQYMLGEVT